MKPIKILLYIVIMTMFTVSFLSCIEGDIYKEVPNNKTELIGIIKQIVSTEGNNADLNRIDTSKITDMSNLFAKRKKHDITHDFSDFNGDISEWDVSKVTNMNSMFYQATKFNSDISGWKVGNVKDMSGMFFQAKEFNQDIGDWDVSKVTDLQAMFFQAKEFNQDIGDWDVSGVIDENNLKLIFNGSGLAGNEPLWYLK